MSAEDKSMIDLNSENMDKLIVALDEAAKATNLEDPTFVEPSEGTLNRATARRNHIVFGRRGSGKTSLLAKAASELNHDEKPIALINLEPFKKHSYPDVLLSVLISSLKEFKKWIKNNYLKHDETNNFIKRLLICIRMRIVIRQKKIKMLVKSIDIEIESLDIELHATDEARLIKELGRTDGTSDSVEASGKISTTVASAGIKKSKSESMQLSSKLTEETKRKKEDFLNRQIIHYREILNQISNLSTDGNAFLFLDDLYQLNRSDQPKVLDYFYRIAKDNNIWLKIGTIQHRTEWYQHSDPPIGLKLGDDADVINLDLNLEDYNLAKKFLLSVLEEIAKSFIFKNIKDTLTNGAIDRLVLASGGVARDYLAVYKHSIRYARERLANTSKSSQLHRITVEDVNKASFAYYPTKQEELKLDTKEERDEIESEFEKVKSFCTDETKSNCFVLEEKRPDTTSKLIDELVDLRLVHRVKSSITMKSGRKGKTYKAFMLDLSQYAITRRRHRFEIIPFWTPKGAEKLRRIRLIYS